MVVSWLLWKSDLSTFWSCYLTQKMSETLSLSLSQSANDMTRHDSQPSGYSTDYFDFAIWHLNYFRWFKSPRAQILRLFEYHFDWVFHVTPYSSWFAMNWGFYTCLTYFLFSSLLRRRPIGINLRELIVSACIDSTCYSGLYDMPCSTFSWGCADSLGTLWPSSESFDVRFHGLVRHWYHWRGRSYSNMGRFCRLGHFRKYFYFVVLIWIWKWNLLSLHMFSQTFYLTKMNSIWPPLWIPGAYFLQNGQLSSHVRTMGLCQQSKVDSPLHGATIYLLEWFRSMLSFQPSLLIEIKYS